jgi:hypothetical protein
VVDIEVFPPLLPSTTAGPTSLSVRIVPQSDPDDVRSAETTLNIAGSFDRRLDVLQPALRGRRGATYEMMLENRGNTLASCRLHLVDPSGRVEADFDPPAAGVEPGASTLIRMKLRSKGLQWERRPRTVPFRISADQPGSPTASGSATFVQTPMVPERLLGRLMALVLVAAGGAGRLVRRGEAGHPRRRRRRRARRHPATTTTVVATIDSPPASPLPPLCPKKTKGTIVNIPLPVGRARGPDRRRTATRCPPASGCRSPTSSCRTPTSTRFAHHPAQRRHAVHVQPRQRLRRHQRTADHADRAARRRATGRAGHLHRPQRSHVLHLRRTCSSAVLLLA